ncbi:hypothetical protein GTA62_18545 [Roseobacter sp. HKCCD9010]|uniref:thermonuclease family protein n=2 Tax=unclassified Roseobacter TaxID=196798 RepID=UPI001490DC7A|nr:MULTISPECIES: thermonuclease family protein [unclassified Roseobacter]MBF9051919.1 hypothetical protein [Rhodobacterales bacterium HKCCD4356]NNV40321.1 hypothetical protein [Roseobacter sp. HKCCD9054]NNV78655.1 hypothetical protein [Roseobacter sp. HKCCD6135]NNW08442.1 hypothetical protein [Roseobacter sp. HKCCD8431]NNW34063.1 hypothetical protein [Roseobacter sp. HKCCD8198]NNW38268.1 hypothetical protein [Roseobacter sp. HKCCD9117-2]NNW51137.1 hypothetical protein [Roseobacter sp. HKCCD9
MTPLRNITGSLALTVMTCLALPAAGDQVLRGQANVKDGDRLVLGSVEISLYGIDAAEARQYCDDATGRAYPCGRIAGEQLKARIGTQSISCETRGRDLYGRYLAVCHAGGVNLNAWLVSEGHALAYRRFSTDFVPQEVAARNARRGLWQGRFVAPWDWRRGVR